MSEGLRVDGMSDEEKIKLGEDTMLPTEKALSDTREKVAQHFGVDGLEIANQMRKFSEYFAEAEIDGKTEHGIGYSGEVAGHTIAVESYSFGTYQDKKYRYVLKYDGKVVDDPQRAKNIYNHVEALIRVDIDERQTQEEMKRDRQRFLEERQQLSVEKQRAQVEKTDDAEELLTLMSGGANDKSEQSADAEE